MTDVNGAFELHLTVPHRYATELARYAHDRDLRFVHIWLDRGETTSQPMLTVYARGGIGDAVAVARGHEAELAAAGIPVVRVKLEADVDADGVPRSDEEAADQPADRYFEHHVKLALPRPTPEDLAALAVLVEPHGSRVSRNARRRHTEGGEQRFVTQRCRAVGAATAHDRCQALVTALAGAGYEVLEVEEEFVVHDSAEHLDNGWLRTGNPYDQRRSAPAGASGQAATYLPLPVQAGVRQRAVLDPALYGTPNAFRTGEPQFADPEEGRRWYAAREAAMTHVLELVATSPLREHLVLRGSTALRVVLGSDARVPGDLDFVVVDGDSAAGADLAQRLVADLVALVGERRGAGLHADDVAIDVLWAYDAADGRRLQLPWSVPGTLPGTVQVDLVFDHRPERPAVPLVVPPLTVPVLAAPPELQLAWKVRWLSDDVWPAAKDLYDATLLAEHGYVDLAVMRDVGAGLGDYEWACLDEVEWEDFRGQDASVPGDLREWLARLRTALDGARAAGGQQDARPAGGGRPSYRCPS